MQKFTSSAANNWPENTTLSSLSKGNNKMPPNTWELTTNIKQPVCNHRKKMPKISKDWQIKNFAEKIHQKIERVIENLLFQCGVKKSFPNECPNSMQLFSKSQPYIKDLPNGI